MNVSMLHFSHIVLIVSSSRTRMISSSLIFQKIELLSILLRLIKMFVHRLWRYRIDFLQRLDGIPKTSTSIVIPRFLCEWKHCFFLNAMVNQRWITENLTYLLEKIRMNILIELLIVFQKNVVAYYEVIHVHQSVVLLLR